MISCGSPTASGGSADPAGTASGRPRCPRQRRASSRAEPNAANAGAPTAAPPAVCGSVASRSISSARLIGSAEARQVQLFHHRHHHPHRMGRAHQIVRTLHHQGHLPAFRRPQPYPRPGFRCRLSHCCVCTAHAFTYNLHPRENEPKKSQALSEGSSACGRTEVEGPLYCGQCFLPIALAAPRPGIPALQ